MKERTNQEWLVDLQGPGRDGALADLRAFLLRGLGYALAGYSGLDAAPPRTGSDAAPPRTGSDAALLEDFVQDALLKILDNLDTFRGESRFTTWAQKIAVRVALTEFRRRRCRDLSLEALTEARGLDFVPDFLVDPGAPPDRQTVQRLFLEQLQRLIDTELTDRQRQALVAVRIQGMPLEEVAQRMGTNRNALYKLLHDARKRLKARMEAEGLSAEDVLAAFGP